MNNVWGNEDEAGVEGLDEFKLQNELAHTMSTIFQPAKTGHFDTQNPFDDANSDSNEDIEDIEDIEDVDDDDDTTGKDVWERGKIEAKKTHLISTLTNFNSTDNNTFLKSPETADIDDILTSKQGNNTPVDGLLQLAASSAAAIAPDNEVKETIETKRQVTSPNRKKIQMLRPRRFQTSAPATIEQINDPLSSETNKDAPLSSPLDSPRTRKSKFISFIDAPLFNIDKDQVLKSVKETPSKQEEGDDDNNTSLLYNNSQNYNDDDENKINFDIIVGDPMTVGDFPNTHTIYTITTKTNCDLFDHEETIVTRRYKDFLWLYHKLLNNHPGFIIPPPPEKQMVNRFDSKFIENRRMALEAMLQQISLRNGLFQKDPAFIVFLQSSDFINESNSMEDGSPISLTDDNYELATMADMMNSMAIVGETPIAGSSGGFFSSLIGGLQQPKYIENNEFIISKQEYINQLDEQLRQLSRSLDMILEKRDELQISFDDLIAVIGQMSDLEVNSEITLIMNNFEELQTKMKELLERSNMSQILTFGTVIDEYIRIIGSIRNCFENRSKIYINVQTLEQNLEKKQRNVEKLKGKPQGNEKLEFAQSEVSRVETLLEKQRKFQMIFNSNFKRDLSRFEFEKVRDMKNMVEIYWEGLIENQKHLIELWEIFYDKCQFQQQES